MSAALLPVVVAGFCWLTALYAFVCASAFAYLQFIRPRVFAWIGAFSDWHVVLCWIWFGLLLVVLQPDIRQRGASRILASCLALVAFLAAVWNAAQPVLPSLADGTRSVVVGSLALVPVLWMALLDHRRASVVFAGARPFTSEDDRRGVDGRLFVASAAATLLVSAMYAVPAAFRIGRAFEPDLQGAGLAIGIVVSIADQALVFLVAGFGASVLGRVSGARVFLQYLVLLAALSSLCAWMWAGVLGGSIGLAGTSARVAAALTGLSIAAFWGGQCLRQRMASPVRLRSAIDVFTPPSAEGRPTPSVVGLIGLGLLATLLFALATRMDWDFVLMNAGVVIVWVAAFVFACRATPDHPRLSGRTMALVCVLPLAVSGLANAGTAGHHALDRYAVHNPSFRLADGLLRRQPKAPSFERYLRAHTGLTDVAVAPTSIDFVQPLASAPGAKPLIFLLVVDSLRPDYLSPYNADVRFTPRIQAFADENLLFSNAFTRYGGTGLSMPAIWAGSAIVHKQYLRPFAPMNALEKLLDANLYRRLVSRDHITSGLWTPSADEVELDRGRGEMEFDFCETLDELAGRLRSGVSRDRPVFAQTRSLNLHVASVRNGYVPPGKSYPGFEPPYAWRVERMDGCFGRFIDALKALGLYDRSLVVLTADHGELIGEDGRWGHSYHMFPEVIQIPLMVHVPRALQVAPGDPDAVSLSTDITPTLYAALGYEPAATNDLMGHALFGASDREWSSRRRGSHVLAASYGAVYAVVSRNGRRLYIADAIKGGDHAYRRVGRRWREVDVDAGVRRLAQLKIRRHVDEIARLYRVDRRF